MTLPFGFGNIPRQPKPPLSLFTIHGTPKYLSASARRPGNYTANHKHTCSPKDAKKFFSVSRNQKRLFKLALATEYINKVAGGEPRKVRRAMARDRAKLVDLARK